jgi:hypothetical protein
MYGLTGTLEAAGAITPCASAPGRREFGNHSSVSLNGHPPTMGPVDVVS